MDTNGWKYIMILNIQYTIYWILSMVCHIQLKIACNLF
jgi:hypothetical protein